MSMISGLLTRIFGSRNQRLLKQYQRTVERVNALETQTASLTDEQLKAKTDEFRGRVAGGESLDQLLPEAFAVVREAARRTLGQRHFDDRLNVFGAGNLFEKLLVEVSSDVVGDGRDRRAGVLRRRRGVDDGG